MRHQTLNQLILVMIGHLWRVNIFHWKSHSIQFYWWEFCAQQQWSLGEYHLSIITMRITAFLVIPLVMLIPCLFQINRVSSWIDGSFVYSNSEAWVNTMRSFENGTLLSDSSGKWPVRNTMRVPLFNQPVPNVLRTLSPERLFCKSLWRQNYLLLTKVYMW